MYSTEDLKDIINNLTAQAIWVVSITLFATVSGGVYFKKTINNIFWYIFYKLSEPVVLELGYIIGIFLIGLGLPFLYSFFKDKYFNSEEYTSYKQVRSMNILGIDWTWGYKAGREVDERTIQPICPECKGKLDMIQVSGGEETKYKYQTIFRCLTDNCDFANIENEYTIGKGKLAVIKTVCSEVDRFLRKNDLKH